MGVWYLIDATNAGTTIKLRFYDPSTDSIKEVTDSSYKPYFFLPYPLTKQDEETVRSLYGEVSAVKKIDLYANEPRDIAKVNIYKPEFLSQATRRFETVWESEIDFCQSYAYDHGLIFGTQHRVQDNDVAPISDIPEELNAKFDQMFGNVKAMDPLKYSQLEYWFALLNQPVPQIKPEMLGIQEDNFDRYYVAFVLLRIANLPFLKAYSAELLATG